MKVNTEKFLELYAKLLADKEEAIAIALAGKDARVAEKVAEAVSVIEADVEAELIAEASAPFATAIEIYENVIEVEVETTEEIVIENDTVSV